MKKYYNFLVVLLLIIQPFNLQIGKANDISQELFSFDEENNNVIDSFYFSYLKASMWIGYFKLEAWFYDNQTVNIKYSFKASGNINLSQGVGSDYFLYLNEFDRKVEGGNWAYHANLIGTVTNWNYDTSQGPLMCDAGMFIKEIKLYKSGSEVNSTIYKIDNNSCSGVRSIPQDSYVIELMGTIQAYIGELVESNQLTVPETQICTPAFNITFFFLTVFVLSLILNKRRF